MQQLCVHVSSTWSSLHDQMICDCEQENQGIYFVSISVPAYIVLPKLRYIDARPIPVYKTVVVGWDVPPPLELSPRTRSPRTSCPPGQLILGPRVPLGQLVLGPCVPP